LRPLLYSNSRDASEIIRKRSDQLHILCRHCEAGDKCATTDTDTEVGIGYLCIVESQDLLAILRKILPPLGTDS